MARNRENEKRINEALEDINRKERVHQLSRRQKAALGAVGLTALGVAYAGAQTANNEALKQEALETADANHISVSEAETHAKQLGEEIAAAIEEGTITPITEKAENGDGYGTLRQAGLERMYEDGQEVKNADDKEYSPLPVALIEELHGDFPRVNDEVIVGFVSTSDFAEDFRAQLEATPPTADAG